MLLGRTWTVLIVCDGTYPVSKTVLYTVLIRRGAVCEASLFHPYDIPRSRVSYGIVVTVGVIAGYSRSVRVAPSGGRHTHACRQQYNEHRYDKHESC